MKEMVYKSERCDAELLACDTYKGFDYYVVSRARMSISSITIRRLTLKRLTAMVE